MNHLWYDYKNWLLDRVGFNNLERRDLGGFHQSDYDALMTALHETEFIYVIDRDENRMRDGLRLRYYFFQDIGMSTDADFVSDVSDPIPCSVLEVLVALAIKIDDNYTGDPADPHPEIVFWDMIKNLGLHKFINSTFNAVEFDKIMDFWLMREFGNDGNGSIFPVKSVTFLSKSEEIWRQATAYISENY